MTKEPVWCAAGCSQQAQETYQLEADAPKLALCDTCAEMVGVLEPDSPKEK